MKDYKPNLPKVTRIELSEKNMKLRWIAIGVLLAIAVAAIGYGMYEMLNVQPGWHTVEITSQNPNYSGEFTLQYDFSEAGGSAAAQLKQLSECYRQAAEEAYQMFDPEADGDVHAINTHINEAVTVDPFLYAILEKLTEETAPHFFLAPAMVEYNRVFLCENDSEADLYDPARNEETAAWLAELAAYLTDPAEISLDVLPDNQVRLNVGSRYLAFAEEYGIEVFFDFGWMRNAFAADFMANALTEAGFTNGYLASYDGFTRNLDTRGTDYAVNIFTRQGNDLYLPAVFHYNVPMSLVQLRDYPQSDRDRWHYYAYETGEILTAFLDPKDAMSKPSIDSVLVYSETRSCGDLVLELLPVFIGESFEESRLAGEGMEAIWCQNQIVRHTEPDAKLELRPESGFRAE